jgi:hypothetical protein
LGYGWSIGTSSPATGEMDLLTVVMHELGHVLGLPDDSDLTSAGDLMDETLATGTRRLPSAADVAAAEASK